MIPKLVGVSGPFRGITVALEGPELSIGRDRSNDLSTNDPALSRRQCTIASDGDSFRLRDLGSRNGTLVNGIPVEQYELHHGDQICVGDSVLVLLLDEDSAHHLERSPVELSETAQLGGPPVFLRPEQAIYLQSELAVGRLPSPARAAVDLNTLLKIAKGIGAIRDLEALQWQLLGAVFDLVPADRGAVLLFDGDEVTSAAGWDRLRGPGHLVRVSRTVIDRVRREKAGLMVTDVEEDTALQAVQSLAEFQVSSLLCVPLLCSADVAGVIYLDTRDASQRFEHHHLELMSAVAAIAALALANAHQYEQLQRENLELRAEIGLDHNMVGHGARMREVFQFIRQVAPTDSTVLLQGESGTGKELVARAVHANSPRKERPFVAINCAAITETLLESELFGHEKGAFTGAVAQKKGKMEAAEGGTLFLDEVSELAPGLQAKLLRVLQEREFERVGGTRTLKLDVRVVAATNQDLSEAVESGKFRRDLFYRLNVVAVTLPPLRERREDIPALADHFIAKAARKCRSRVKPLSLAARASLLAYDWPGNVRELENALERALVLGGADQVLLDDLPESVVESGPTQPQESAQFHGALKETKKQLVLRALQAANGNYIEAAK